MVWVQPLQLKCSAFPDSWELKRIKSEDSSPLEALWWKYKMPPNHQLVKKILILQQAQNFQKFWMWHYTTDHIKTLIFNPAEFHKVTAFSGDLSCVSLTVLLSQGLMEDTASCACHELVRAWLFLALLGTEKCIRASSSRFSLNSN